MVINNILYILSILVGFVVVLFQICLLVECGLIRTRVGDRVLEKVRDLATFIGKSTALEPSSSAVFISLSCSTCQTLVRQLDESQDPAVNIYLVDVAEGREDEIRNKIEVSNIRVRPGKKLFETIAVREVPLFIKTDKSGNIEKIKSITDIDQID